MVTDYYGVAMFNATLWFSGRHRSPDYRSPAWGRTSQFFGTQLALDIEGHLS